MSWMTPPPSLAAGGVAGWLADVRSADTYSSRRLSGPCGRAGPGNRVDGRVGAEQLLDPVAALFHPAQREAQGRDAVANRVVDLVGGQPDKQAALVERRAEAPRSQRRLQLLGALLDLDKQNGSRLGHRADGVRPQQAPTIDRDEMVADLLDLAQQVGRDHDRDTELRPDPRDQVEHGGPAGWVQTVRRLVQQQYPR